MLQELAEFQRNPVAADGTVFVGGEAGYIQPQRDGTVQVQQARVTKNGPRKRHAGPEVAAPTP